MKTTLAFIALSLSTTAFAQVSEPEIRVIGAGVRAGGAGDNIGAGGSEKRAAPADFVPEPGKARDDVVRSFLVDYARCINALDKRGVERLMTMVPGTNAYAQTAKRVAVNQCMAAGDMKIKHSSLHGALYMYRYKSDFGAVAPALKPDPVDYAVVAGNADKQWAAPYIAYRKLAQCVVRADPVASRALVMGPVGSAAEANAIGTLGPSLSACIEKGATLNLTKERLAGIVAEALYRLSMPERRG